MSIDKTINVYGALLVLLGIIIILTPWIIFPVCEMEGSYVVTSTGMKLPVLTLKIHTKSYKIYSDNPFYLANILQNQNPKM
jgi:hypothetical protein